MPYINLLPWRENARRELQQQFIAILAGVSVVTVFFVMLLNYFFATKLEGQQKRNQHLQREIATLDQRIREIKNLNETKAGLNQRIKLIEHLQSSRNLGTQILNEVSLVVPAGIYLTKIEKKSSELLVNGKSESNNRLANMIRQIEQSSLLNEATLESIVAGNTELTLLSDFTMVLAVEDEVSEPEGEQK